MIKVIKDNFNYSRYIYNKALETWNILYQEYQKDPSAPKPNHYLVRNTLVANKEDWERGLSSRVLQTSVRQVERSFKNFWNPNMPNHKKPKFKRKKNESFIQSYTTDRVSIKNGKLFLDKARGYQGAFFGIRMAEQPGFYTKLKAATIIKKVDGYYAALNYDFPEVNFIIKDDNKELITGVDVNVGHFNYKEDGNFKEVQTFTPKLKELYQKVNYYQKVLSKKVYNSKNYQKARAKLRLIYQRIKNIQSEITNQFVSKLIKNYHFVVIEDLAVNQMMMNKQIKSIHRSLFGQFKDKMITKVNSNVILAHQFYPSTQRCSNCGEVKKGEDKIGLSGNKKHKTNHSQYHCYSCYIHLDRDENAVDNLIDYGKNYLKI